MVIHQRNNHDAWCRKIVRACYAALAGNLSVLILIWWFWGRQLGDAPHERLFYWWNYILLPTGVELAITALVHLWVRKRLGSLQARRYAVLFLLVFYCTFLTLTYRVVAVLLLSFLIPVFVSAIFSDRKILWVTTLTCAALLPLCAAVMSTATLRVHEYIWVEMWTALALLLAAHLLAGILMNFNRENLESIRASYESQVDLEEMLRRDLFTGLFNRSTFDRLLPKVVARSIEQKRALCLAILDLDDFKKINDTCGHACGDEVLLLLAEILLRRERNGVLAFRYGGEEFALLFEGFPLGKAREICEEMRQEMETESKERHKRRITFSCGLAELKESITDGYGLFGAADQAMYTAKGNGKNQVVVAFEAPADQAGV